MSKSKGNVLYPEELVSVFGVDAVRYFVLHEMPFENDGIISYELMVERINSELANTLGNLVNRTISMSNKYFEGIVNNKNIVDSFDEELKEVALSTVTKVVEKMDKLRVADAISEIFVLFKRCNKYIDETLPWVLAKEEKDHARLETVLYNLVESICIGANLLEPFMPTTSVNILKQLNTNKRDLSELNKFGKYPSGNKVTSTPEILFARLDIKEVLAKVEESKEIDETNLSNYPKVELKTEISIDDFDKIQIQVGEIISCESVKKAKKLLVSQIRIGDTIKQIVSGIALHYKPEEMVGKKVAVITNLKPVKLCGIDSEGMILAASDDEGNLSILTVDKDIISGSEIC